MSLFYKYEGALHLKQCGDNPWNPFKSEESLLILIRAIFLIMKQKFNPNDWLSKNEGSENSKPSNQQPSNQQPSNHPSYQPSSVSNDIELVISRIEAACTDITSSYSDWLNIGFALADEFGEGGRDFFHRISKFYAKYSLTDCNRQFDQCVKAQGHGITIKTIFHLAKLAGVDIGRDENDVTSTIPSNSNQGSGSTTHAPIALPPAPILTPIAPEPEVIELPTLPESVYAALPEFLQKVVAKCETNEERDVMLIGALATLSSVFPKVFGIYGGKKVYSNIFLFVTALASAGKGLLVLCKKLVNPVHWELRKLTHQMKAQYEIEMREYNLQKAKDFTIEKPNKPPERMLIIPANNSTTGVFQLLSDNEGKGLIFETEGDTLAQAFKTDYGNYSDGFRKAFHHETISYYRRTDHEFVEIDNPCLSTVLSGTPKQVATLIPNAENGLFSRFIFYHMNIVPVWKDMFADNIYGLEPYFDDLGQEFYPLYKALEANPDIEFCITQEQKKQFHTFFTQFQEKYLTLQGSEYMATIRRLGLIAFRIAMIFTTLRILETGDFSEKQVCSDGDFQAALSMVRILVKHSSHVYSELPVDVQPTTLKNRKEQFLDKLPEKFTRQEYLDIAKSLSIPARTAELYISKFNEKGLIFNEQYGSYINLTISKKNNEKGEGEAK